MLWLRWALGEMPVGDTDDKTSIGITGRLANRNIQLIHHS